MRIGNGAALQYQADVVGEVMVALHAARVAGLGESITSWPLQRALLNRALIRVGEPDNGIWEIRGEPQLFTHSRAMNWAAFDRGVRAVREYGLDRLCGVANDLGLLSEEYDVHRHRQAGNMPQAFSHLALVRAADALAAARARGAAGDHGHETS